LVSIWEDAFQIKFTQEIGVNFSLRFTVTVLSHLARKFTYRASKLLILLMNKNHYCLPCSYNIVMVVLVLSPFPQIHSPLSLCSFLSQEGQGSAGCFPGSQSASFQLGSAKGRCIRRLRAGWEGTGAEYSSPFSALKWLL